jgi:hypothetical protein
MSIISVLVSTGICNEMKNVSNVPVMRRCGSLEAMSVLKVVGQACSSY